MEFSKTEKVDLDSVRGRGPVRSPLTDRIKGLDVADSFTVSGVKRARVSSVTDRLRRTEHRRFVVNEVGDGVFRVTRVE